MDFYCCQSDSTCVCVCMYYGYVFVVMGNPGYVEMGEGRWVDDKERSLLCLYSVSLREEGKRGRDPIAAPTSPYLVMPHLIPPKHIIFVDGN